MSPCQPLVGGKSYKYPARQSHVLRGTTPHCDVKTLRLGTRFHQRKEDNSRLDLDSSAPTYPPESGQSRCLSLSSRRDWVMRLGCVRGCFRYSTGAGATSPQPYQLVLLGRNGVEIAPPHIAPIRLFLRCGPVAAFALSRTRAGTWSGGYPALQYWLEVKPPLQYSVRLIVPHLAAAYPLHHNSCKRLG